MIVLLEGIDRDSLLMFAVRRYDGGTLEFFEAEIVFSFSRR